MCNLQGVNDGSGILFYPPSPQRGYTLKSPLLGARGIKDIANSVLKRPKFHQNYYKHYFINQT